MYFGKKRNFLNKPQVYTTKFLFWRTLDQLDQIKQENPNYKTALDVPAGGGAIAKYMVESLGWLVQTSDIDPSKYDYSAPFQKADLGRKLPYPDESFDVTVCMEGLKHLTDIDTAISEITRVTRKGGTILISIPNDLCLQTRVRYLFDGFVDCDWYTPIDPKDENIKNYLYCKSLISLPYLYFFLVSNGLEMKRTTTSHFRFQSVLLMVLLYPILVFYNFRRMRFAHPLFKEMISPTWLAGKRNIIIAQKQ